MCHDDLRILIAWCLVTFRFGWPQPRCFSWTSFWDVHFIWSGHSLHEMLQQISHRQRDNASWYVFYGRASQILHYNLTINQYEYIFFIWFCKYISSIYIQPTGWRYIRIYIVDIDIGIRVWHVWKNFPRWCIFSGFYLPSSLILRPSASCIETASILAQHFGAEVMVDPLLAREASKPLQGHVFFVLNPGFPQIFRKKLQLVLFILRWFFGNSWHAGLCSDVVWISGPCGWKNRPSDFEIGATLNRNHNKKMFEYCVDPPREVCLRFFFTSGMILQLMIVCKKNLHSLTGACLAVDRSQRIKSRKPKRLGQLRVGISPKGWACPNRSPANHLGLLSERVTSVHLGFLCNNVWWYFIPMRLAMCI